MSTHSAAPADQTTPADEAAPPKEQPSKEARGGQVTLQTLLTRLDAAEKSAAEREKRAREALGEMGRKLDEANSTIAAVSGHLDTLKHHFLALQAVVRAALPSQLLRLSHEHLKQLAAHAPSTRIRLLAPLKGPNLVLTEGKVLPVSDQRISVYMSVVQAALVVDDADDVAVHVRQIIAAEVEAQVEAAKARDKEAAESEAAALEAQAEALRGPKE